MKAPGRAALLVALAMGACSPSEPPAPQPRPAADPPPPADAVAPTPAPPPERVDVRPPPAPARESARDQEPNDGWRDALPLPVGVSVEGRVDRPTDPAVGDQDWYVVQVPGDAPALMRVELVSPPDLDVVLEWMPPSDDDKPRAIVQADVIERKPGDELLPALRVEPGPVYLRVREAWYRGRDRTGSDQPYELTATLSAWEPTMEAEPDDTAEHAVTLALGETGRGTLGHIKDRDVWRVPLGADAPTGPITVSATGVSGVEMRVSLAFAGTDLPPVKGRAAADQGVTFRHLAVPDPAPEALLVTLRTPRAAAPEAAYSLTVATEEPSEEPFETEPNDAPSHATPAPGERAVGHIDRGGDVDAYRLDVTEATTLHAVLAPPLEVDLAMRLIGPDGVEARVIDEGGPGDAEILRAFGVTPGAWTLSVSGKDASHHDARRPYVLELGRKPAGTGEAEPNDARGQSATNPVVLGNEASGWIHPRGDVDWWLLDLQGQEEGSIVTFQVRPAAGVSLDVSVHDPAGARLVGREGLVPPETTTFTFYLEPGEYYLRCTSGDEAAANARDAYRLTVIQ